MYGEMPEWFKEPVLKTGDTSRYRGFESHSLRQQCGGLPLTVYWSVARERRLIYP